MGEGGHLRTFCGLLADSVRTGGLPLRDVTPSCGCRLGQQNEAGEPGGMAPSPNRLTAAGTQTTGKHVRDVASSRPWILGGRHQPDYALTSGTFADTARPAGVWPLGPGWPVGCSVTGGPPLGGRPAGQAGDPADVGPRGPGGECDAHRLVQRAGGGGLPGGGLFYLLEGLPSGDVPAPFLPHPVLVGGLQVGPRAGGGQPPRRRIGQLRWYAGPGGAAPAAGAAGDAGSGSRTSSTSPGPRATRCPTSRPNC